MYGLVMLLLLSPCKVRNFIQAELELPQTETLNKSQATITPSDCLAFENSDSIEIASKLRIQSNKFLISKVSFLDFELYLPKSKLNLRASSRPKIIDVPLYILFQNPKVYS